MTTNNQTTAPTVYQEQYENEISLVDLVAVLVNRKKTIYWVFLFIVLLGITAAFLLPEKYSYSTTIEIGQRIERGEVKLIDETETLLAKINKTYIPLALQEYYKAHPDDENIYEVTGSIPKKSHIIVLSSKGAEKEAEILQSLSQEVVNKVILDHSRLINIIKANHEFKIKSIENNILSVKGQAEIYKADLFRVDKNIILIKSQIKSVNSMVEDGLINRKKASLNVKSESSATTLLMIENEINQNRNKIDSLEERLIIDMSNKKDVLNKRLSDTHRKLLTKSDEVALKKLELENIRYTRALIIGLKSLKPISLSKSNVSLLSIFMAFLISIFSAFIHETIVNIRNELS